MVTSKFLGLSQRSNWSQKLLLSALFLGVMCISLSAAAQQALDFPHAVQVQLSNPLPQARQSVQVLIPETQLLHQYPNFNPQAFVVMDGQRELPSQYLADKGEDAGIVLVLDRLAGKETRVVKVLYKQDGVLQRSYPQRAQAEVSAKVGGQFKDKKYLGGQFQNLDTLRVPAKHTDHSYYIRYEGPGWESDKIGYRFYLDWRKATDVFGKRTPEIVLQQVGQDGFDSYHSLQDWGMDVLKVGPSLGVGSLAYFTGGTAVRIEKTDSVRTFVAANGPLQAGITTQYWGWQVAGKKMDVSSQLSIHAGSRLTRHRVEVRGATPEHLCTGLHKDKNARMYSSKGSAESWGYLATWGKQSLNNDQLGIAVLFRSADLQQLTEDENNHLAVFKSQKGTLSYYFLAAWELEQAGIKSEEEFLDYLKQTAQELAMPVKVQIASKSKNTKQ